MTGFQTHVVMVFSVLIWNLKPSRTLSDVHCRDDLEYSNGNLCCLKCPADQEIVRPCTHIQDAECQCRLGRFCAPDEACEVCRKCSRCKQDEEIVRNCTHDANTECKKMQPKDGSASASAKASVIVPLVLVAAGIIFVIIVGVVAVYRHRRTTDSRGNLSNRLKPGQHPFDSCPTDERSNGETRRPSCSNLILSRQLVRAKSSFGMEDERKVLCESLSSSASSSASNSQHSLTGLPSSAFPAPPPQASIVVPRQPDRREDEQFLKLVPVNGEESLRKCFEYFEDIDFNHHKRFFRHLGIVDNVIKSKEHLLYEDKIHELLNIWVEKEGRDATLNDLLKALLDLNQRRTAETVKEKAILNDHYFSEN
ncbi:hematopoietic death receptor isoform X2 [Sebastes umbrosus]|uniref:hematopoietic death receptor isoform X2 n=1 Tax=Sebastes umbrosus TaxID=72105 RepID=UPI00189E03E8|nr:hematopoietic death receptor isoform X2 [Sebastes umbrosus]